MAVVEDADEIDRALSLIPRLMERDQRTDADRFLAAAALLSLWHLVFEDAMKRGDAQLALIASGEHQHARSAFRALLGDPPPI